MGFDHIFLIDKIPNLKPQPNFIQEFQANPLENPKQCNIIIDYREKDIIHELISILEQEFHRANISLETLKVGDFKIISPNGEIEFIIERKSIPDLISSIKDGRLDHQIPELLDQDNSFITIVGEPYDLKHWAGMNIKGQDTVTKILTGISLRKNLDGNKLPQFILPNIRQLAVQIDYIAKSIEEGKLTRVKDGTLKTFKKLKKSNLNDVQYLNQIRLNQLAIIPKVGINKARDVFRWFNWEYKIIQNASVEEIVKAKIKGIGKVLAKLIYDVYNDEVGTNE